MDDDEMRRRGTFWGDRLFLRLLMRDLLDDDGCIVADDLGLDHIRTLTTREKIDLMPSLGQDGMTRAERHNFLVTPLMLETVDRKGQTVYVAVVIGYVSEQRDARIVIRTAEHLARLTGHPARPVVAARLISDRLDAMVEAKEVFWHVLDHSFLERLERPLEAIG